MAAIIRFIRPEEEWQKARRERLEREEQEREEGYRFWKNENRKERKLERARQLLRDDKEQRQKRRAQARSTAEYKRKQEKRAGRPAPDACEICGESRELVFDHCHAKGHFRGWICNACNVALGMVRDSVVVLRKMADYLERNRISREAD